MKTFSEKQPYILKSLDILINDKQKINNLGAPIRLISHDLFDNDPEINVIKINSLKKHVMENYDFVKFKVKMRIEGKKRTADLIFDAEKNPKSGL